MKRALTIAVILALVPQFLGCMSYQGLQGQRDPQAATPTPDTESEPKPKERSFSTYVEDEKLERDVANAIRLANAEFIDSHINVYCFNNVVLLTGEVPSVALKTQAGQRAQKIDNVRLVHNQLIVKSNASTASRAYDSWLSSKLKLKMMGLDNIESERVKVIVENQIVYLMGLLNEQEANQVSQTAASVNGVTKVVKVFEYSAQ